MKPCAGSNVCCRQESLFLLNRSMLGWVPVRVRWGRLLTLAMVIAIAAAGCGESDSNPPAPAPTPTATSAPTSTPTSTPTPITARMLVEPGALVGSGPSSFAWSPTGARLAYVAPIADGGADVLWLYDPATGVKRVILDPSGQADSIDVTSAQWSPQGNSILLSGANALWLLDIASGTLGSLAEGGSSDAPAFLPSGTAVSFVRANNLYTARISDGHVARFTFDGSATIYNGTLDWVYNEEIATRTAQPAYSWSPDGRWLLLMRTDDGLVASYPITSFKTDPPTTLFTRYPMAGSPNPAVSLHLIAVRDGQMDQAIALPEAAEYILPFFTWVPDSSEAFYITLNRAHTVLELKAWNPTTGTGRSVIQETDSHWINEFLYSAPVFLGPAAGVDSAGPLPFGSLQRAKSDRLLIWNDRSILADSHCAVSSIRLW